jgi:hypothetical protein
MSEVTTEALKASIISKVTKCDWVTFAELSRISGTAGDGSLCTHSKDGNTEIVFWGGMSPQFTEAIIELTRDRLIAAVPSSLMVYMIDGAYLRLPIPTTRQLAARSTKPRQFWVPLSFRPFHSVKEKDRIPLGDRTPKAGAA